MIKRLTKKILIVLFGMLLFSVVSSQSIFAQPDGEVEPGGGEDPFADIPIDGGALALLAGGAALGYKALKKKREDNAEKE